MLLIIIIEVLMYLLNNFLTIFNHFLEKEKKNENRTIFLTTSWEGTCKTCAWFPVFDNNECSVCDI
jgi:hypothetical protein